MKTPSHHRSWLAVLCPPPLRLAAACAVLLAPLAVRAAGLPMLNVGTPAPAPAPTGTPAPSADAAAGSSVVLSPGDFKPEGTIEKTTAQGSEAWCGVAVAETPAEIRSQLSPGDGAGVLIVELVPDGPAQKAGVKTNDVLFKLNDDKITDPAQFQTLLNARKAGDSIQLGYLRDGEESSMKMTLGRRPAKELEAAGPGMVTTGLMIATMDQNGHTTSVEKLDNATFAQVEAKLRATGMSRAEIAKLRAKLAKSTEPSKPETKEEQPKAEKQPKEDK